MQNRLVGLVSAALLTSMAAAACSSGGGKGGASGASGGGTGGTAGASSGGGSGGTGGSGTGISVTSLSGGTAVTALTPAQVTQLCDDTYAYFGSAIPKATSCKWRGLSYAASSSAPTQAQLQQGCTNKETACQPTDPWADNLGCNDIPTTCTATVAQYTACISAEVAAFIQAVNGLPTCATLTSAGPPAVIEAETANPPASCASLADTCPELYP